MNQRLTAAAAIAVVLASASEFFLIHGVAWLVTAMGAVAIVALAGTLTRLAPIPAAFGATMLAGIVAVPMLAATALSLKVAGAAIIACCAASGTRLRLLRGAAGLVSYLAALLLYLNALRASSQSFALFIPTGSSLHHLLRLAGNGIAGAKFAPPVPQTPGVVVLAAGSIGLAAIVIDVLAVRLHRPAIAGLPLLVIYFAPLASAAHVQGPWAITAFLLAAAGYLGLLASDGRTRLRGWGRVISVWHRPGETERLGGADVTALAATGRRIGMAALCAAVVAPLLLPTLNLHRLFAGQASGGGGTVVGLPDPVVELHGLLSETRPQTVLTYRSNSADPGQYLQVYVLNYDQDQSKWLLITPGRKTAVRSAPLPPPPGLASYMPQTSTTMRISLDVTSGYASPLLFLPVPYWPEQVTESGTWWESADTLMVFSGQSGQQAKSYVVTSGQAEPTTAMLDMPQHVTAALRPYLGFDSPVTSQLLKIARRVTASQTTAFGKAVALERWFHSGKFTYAVNSTVPNSPRGLLAFLTTNPQGFCQQFAFAMAVLARLVGIPSRVAIGYTAGSLRHGQWVVTTSDAHAWPELYFQGAGWLRFEPTPGGSLGQGTAVEPSYVTAVSASKGGTKRTGGHNIGPSSSPAPRSSVGALNKLRGLNQAANSAASAAKARTGSGVAALAGLIAAALLLAAAAVPGTARIVTRRRRWSTAVSDLGLAHAAWREVRADLADFGLPCLTSESPRAMARRVGAAVGDDEAAQDAVGRIAAVVERAYYAPVPAAATAVRGDVALVRRSLAKNARWGKRLRARLLPASVIDPALATVSLRLGAVTGWVPTREEATA